MAYFSYMAGILSTLTTLGIMFRGGYRPFGDVPELGVSSFGKKISIRDGGSISSVFRNLGFPISYNAQGQQADVANIILSSGITKPPVTTTPPTTPATQLTPAQLALLQQLQSSTPTTSTPTTPATQLTPAQLALLQQAQTLVGQQGQPAQGSPEWMQYVQALTPILNTPQGQQILQGLMGAVNPIITGLGQGLGSLGQGLGNVLSGNIFTGGGSTPGGNTQGGSTDPYVSGGSSGYDIFGNPIPASGGSSSGGNNQAGSSNPYVAGGSDGYDIFGNPIASAQSSTPATTTPATTTPASGTLALNSNELMNVFSDAINNLA